MAIALYFTNSIAQDTAAVSLDNNMTGVYTKSDQTKQFILNFTGENSINTKRLYMQAATNYSLTVSGGIVGNELTQNLTANYRKKYLMTGTYGYSLYREQNISTLGLGAYLVRKKAIRLSYAAIYERVDRFDARRQEKLRHSLKIGLSAKRGQVEASGNVYYQPSMSNPKDYTLYGLGKISFSPNERLSIIAQSLVDYRSTNDVKLISNVTLGVGYTFRR